MYPIEKYRNAKVGDLVTFGAYPQTDVVNKTPIEWRVLENNGDELFLLSEKILDCKPYNHKTKTITWEDSEIRKWLNGEFYAAAFFGVNAYIKKTRVSGNGVISSDDTPETYDNVFLLNTQEAYALGRGDHNRCRWAQGTLYAKVKELKVCGYGKYNGNSGWWLRNRGGLSADYAAYVKKSGKVSRDGGDIEGFLFNCSGVRPALKLNLNFKSK